MPTPQGAIGAVLIGNEIAVLKGHTGGVFTAAFSGDGKRVVTASGVTTPRASGMRDHRTRAVAHEVIER